MLEGCNQPVDRNGILLGHLVDLGAQLLHASLQAGDLRILPLDLPGQDADLRSKPLEIRIYAARDPLLRRQLRWRRRRLDSDIRPGSRRR